MWKDEEGDVILMDTQQEWEEALSCSPSPIKLFINMKEVSQEANDEPQIEEVDHEEEEEEEEPTPPFSLTPEYFYSESGEESISNDEKVHLTTTIPEIMSRLVSPYGALPGWLLEAISATSSSGDILLDVNISQFAYALHSRALKLLVLADNEPQQQADFLRHQAIPLLRDTVLLTPGDSTANFNLACALSLVNDIEGAFASLEKFMATGGQLANIMGDADLENVRNSPRFAEFSKRHTPEEEKKESSVLIEDVDDVDDMAKDFEKLELPADEPSTPEPSAPEPVVPSPEVSPSAPELPSSSPSCEEPEVEPLEKWEKELARLKEFGIEEEIARILLEDFDGDLDAIMNAQFQSQFF